MASLLPDFHLPRRHCHDDGALRPRLHLHERRRRAEHEQVQQPSAIALPKSMRPRHKPKGGADGGGPMRDYDELVDDSKNEPPILFRRDCEIWAQ